MFWANHNHNHLQTCKEVLMSHELDVTGFSVLHFSKMDVWQQKLESLSNNRQERRYSWRLIKKKKEFIVKRENIYFKIFFNLSKTLVKKLGISIY